MPRRPPDYRRIADDIRKKIIDGEYPPGSRLPTHRELMAAFRTSDQPVRAAMELLSVEGWVETQQGKGSFVVDHPPLDSARSEADPD